jgi:hypothetical protein
LVALAVVQIGTKIEGEKTAKTLQETHDTVMLSHDELHYKLDIILAMLEEDSHGTK